MKIVTVCCKCNSTDILFEDKTDPSNDQVDHDICDECREKLFGDEE